MTPSGPWRRFTTLLLGLAFLPARADAGPPDAAAFDAVVNEALKTWRTPGLAVSIVRDDEVIYLKGAGVRELGGNDPVTPDTVFGIGGLTQGFTSTALAQLIDDGKADWDDPVRKRLPTFRLLDPLADRDVTLRDLLCHRTGLGRHDLLWHGVPWSLEETVHRMAYLEPDHSFRSACKDDGLDDIAAGLAVGSASKGAWREFVQKRLLDPLGMNGALFTRTAVLKAPDHASPHGRNAADKVVVLPWYADDAQVNGSTSMKMGVRDLGKWLRFQLAGGFLDGKRLVSAAALAETHTPQIVTPLDPALARMTETTQSSYGMGWRISDYRGKVLWDAGGAADGFRARILLAPREKVGVAVLMNLDDIEAVEAVGYSLLDAALGLPKKDWNAFFAARLQQAEETRKARAESRAASRKPGTKPSRELEAYTGTYEEPAYGTVKVMRDGDALALHWSGFDKPLRHFHYDTFQIDEADERGAGVLAGELVAFTLDADGEPDVLRFLGRKFRRTAAGAMGR